MLYQVKFPMLCFHFTAILARKNYAPDEPAEKSIETTATP
jgi:hypothetical protein